MKTEIVEAAEMIGSNPKSSVLLTAAFTSNAWIDLGLPTVQALTSIVGLLVLVLLAAKHATDLYKTWKKK
tara:strand:+ start:279 stop:488 length:210 start_codon:yes stop_codon:yes gene_type:complete